MMENPAASKTFGYIVGGSLKETLRARLTVPPGEVQEGAFVVIDSGRFSFYGLVTDLQLGATDPRFADEQSEQRLPARLSSLLHGQTLFTTLEILPALMTERPPELDDPDYEDWRRQHPEDPPAGQKVKTVPAHHAPVRLAGAGDVAEIFGDPNEPGQFVIGHTREYGLPVCIDLGKLVQRSSGIFGATGTGKSFLARIVLAGLIQHNTAGALIFDMHTEYGPDVSDSDRKTTVPGLKTKFPSKVRLVGLGRGTDFQGRRPDFDLEIAEQDISPADVEMLTRELNLKETTPTTLAALERSFGANWFTEFKAMKYGATIEDEDGKKIPAPDSVAAWANEAGINVAAAEGLHSKLTRVFNKNYIQAKPAADTVGEIIKALEAGQHVVLSFGKNSSDLDYLLVTNLLTRRIRSRWEELTERYQSRKDSNPPRPLTIVLEEAHKLLSREMSSQTAFGVIAREMRKYYVTLLVIDQRPSQIDDEVVSQLGTRICGWLGDDLDIQAALSGLAGKDSLRGMLARLQPKEEVLIMGWGVPMPIPIRSRRYDNRFYDDLLGKSSAGRSKEELSKNLGW